MRIMRHRAHQAVSANHRVHDPHDSRYNGCPECRRQLRRRAGIVDRISPARTARAMYAIAEER
jgi:hypothetical protein